MLHADQKLAHFLFFNKAYSQVIISLCHVCCLHFFALHFLVLLVVSTTGVPPPNYSNGNSRRSGLPQIFPDERGWAKLLDLWDDGVERTGMDLNFEMDL